MLVHLVIQVLLQAAIILQAVIQGIVPLILGLEAANIIIAPVAKKFMSARNANVSLYYCAITCTSFCDMYASSCLEATCAELVTACVGDIISISSVIYDEEDCLRDLRQPLLKPLNRLILPLLKRMHPSRRVRLHLKQMSVSRKAVQPCLELALLNCKQSHLHWKTALKG